MLENIIIKGTGRYLPKNKVYNEYFVEHFDKMGLKSEGLMNHLGRRKRYLASEDESSISMGFEAAKDALDKLNLSGMDLDMLVFVSDTPEYLIPSNALKLVDMLQANNVILSFDFNSNCTGMVSAMDVVTNYMKGKSEINKAMIVGSFHISSVAKADDTVVYPNFADASAAVILEKVLQEDKKGVLDGQTFVDASYQHHVTLPKCGNSKITSENIGTMQKKLEWNPFDMGFISDRWVELITKTLNKNNLVPNDVDYYIFSQLSDPDNLETLRKLSVGEEKYFFLGKEYGYTGNTCPFLVLDRMWKTIANEGNKVVFCSVGAGYSTAVILYEF